MLSNKAYSIYILFASLALMALTGHEAKAQTDSLYYDLDSATFTIQKHSSSIKRVDPHVTEIDINMIQALPKIMGNTDPVSFIKNLPGVQTGAEYDSGIHIQGCDNAHNDISLAGVPIYGANHLFGLFSVFNPSHYSNMTFSRKAEGNRLGGSLRMELPDTLKKENLTGDVSVGIMSSQGTLGLRSGDRSHLRISVRQSYMNLLYKRWLKIQDNPIRYGFGDYNISWLFKPSDRDRIWVEGYFGHDKAVVAEHKFNISLDVWWGNYSGAIHWEHKGSELTHRHTLFVSGYSSDGLMTQNESALNLTSFINTTGYKGLAAWKDFRWNAEVNLHDILPQSPHAEGLYGMALKEQERQRSLESSASVGYRRTFADRWDIKADIRGSFYLSPERQYDLSLSPDISVAYNAYHLGKVTASYGIRHQYLFQAGLSNIGLPVEFWFAAGKYSLPQYARQADISYDINLFQDALALSVNAYYKRLYNQAEYKGDMFDFFNSKYDLNKHLLKGDGWNYGLNLMVHKQTGKLTGWLSYSLGRALRRFDNKDYTGIYPANHERIHELNAVCAYRMGRWDFSGTFVYASGAPFTPPEHYYISAGQIMTKPGEHNAYRMRPYIRMDLSATFSIKKNEKVENGINFSLYNVTGRKNDMMYRLNFVDGTYSYGRMAFFLQWVPSVSYYHKF